jgi:hypothetical protein
VERILIKDNNHLLDINDLDRLFKEAYYLMVCKNISLWGVYPVNNLFFMKKDEMSYDLKFIIGCFYGFINKKNIILNKECEGKEDYENTILNYINDKGVIRFNNITFKTKFKSKGGLGNNKKLRNMLDEEATDYLIKEYPLYCKKINRKERYEVRLIKQKK